MPISDEQGHTSSPHHSDPFPAEHEGDWQLFGGEPGPGSGSSGSMGVSPIDPRFFNPFTPSPPASNSVQDAGSAGGAAAATAAIYNMTRTQSPAQISRQPSSTCNAPRQDSEHGDQRIGAQARLETGTSEPSHTPSRPGEISKCALRPPSSRTYAQHGTSAVSEQSRFSGPGTGLLRYSHTVPAAQFSSTGTSRKITAHLDQGRTSGAEVAGAVEKEH